ncbi:MAG: ABC transporter permease [Oscillospiraceae bacterium]
MGKFIFKRLLQLIVVLFVVSVIIFVMVRLSATDPVAVILGGKQTSPEVIANVRAKFKLDLPPLEQYFSWVSGMLRGDFGIGYKYQQPVAELIATRLPVTLGLVALGSFMAIIMAIPLGIICALKRNTIVDRTISITSLVLVSCPPFLTSIIMILVVTNFWPTFPITGSYATFGQYLQRICLPAIALAFSMIALSARVTRTSMIEQLQAKYTETGIAKGMPHKTVVYRHALKNAIIPVITVASIQIGSMIVGAVLVENVFSLAGLGALLVDSIKASDYPLVQGITMLMVVIFLIISTVVDMLYAAIDPRIRNK